jgi:hypothetical protein
MDRTFSISGSLCLTALGVNLCLLAILLTREPRQVSGGSCGGLVPAVLLSNWCSQDDASGIDDDNQEEEGSCD